MGGNGGDGGAGGKVVITNDRDLTTIGDDSHGIFAQSIGGGGGNGGSSTTLAVFGGVGIGGAGGKGGAAETVTINAQPQCHSHADHPHAGRSRQGHPRAVASVAAAVTAASPR